jgi:tRNA C32,U32 (ribose-2'-O)-methylase TrmJ
VYHSLNVATALSVALYEYRRQWPGQDTTTSEAGGEGAVVAAGERA